MNIEFLLMQLGVVRSSINFFVFGNLTDVALLEFYCIYSFLYYISPLFFFLIFN